MNYRYQKQESTDHSFYTLPEIVVYNKVMLGVQSEELSRYSFVVSSVSKRPCILDIYQSVPYAWTCFFQMPGFLNSHHLLISHNNKKSKRGTVSKIWCPSNIISGYPFNSAVKIQLCNTRLSFHWNIVIFVFCKSANGVNTTFHHNKYQYRIVFIR